MHYRLTFEVTADTYLHIRAVRKDFPTLSAIHLSDAVFAAALKLANIPQPKRDELAQTAKRAFINPGIDVCCEEVELNQDQLAMLCLVPNAST